MKALAAVVATSEIGAVQCGWVPLRCRGVIGLGLCLSAKMVEYEMIHKGALRFAFVGERASEELADEGGHCGTRDRIARCGVVV